MPTLEFKGKQSVYSHHLSVPFRELIVDQEKSLPAKGAKPSLDDNLIIHGDNLEALKALLPRYAGKVDVIYIDPPYNTGNEGWAYNDNVNAPLMKQWLGKVVDREDLERHDKWLCMMWPRLQLLKELLADTGTIWVTLDDNEIASARIVMDEVFGEDNFLTTVIWHKNYAPKATVKYFSSDHDYVLVYASRKEEWAPTLLERTDEQDSAYKNPDNDPRGDWRPNNLAARNYYSKGTYPIRCPGGRVIAGPPQGSYWRVSEEKLWALHADGRIWWGDDGNNVPAPKIFLSEVRKGRVPQTLWHWKDVGHTQAAKKTLLEIFKGDTDVFISPKPVPLINRLIDIQGGENALILDSFAGSGTTAHAVLAANQQDGGSRKFILVDLEDYADTLTAERVRRVIKGVPNAKDEALRNGLGGSFTYCELGEPIDLERFFNGGRAAPAWDQVARYIVFTATGASLETTPEKPDDLWFVGEAGGYRIHLIYKPDRDWMKSDEAALTAELAGRIAAAAGNKPVLVYAAQKFMSQKALPRGVTFCQLPYSIYRILGDTTDA